MIKLVKHILLFLFLVVATSTFAQQGTNPVGVNFIVVNFASPPSIVNIYKAPLKYNKLFALSMQIDDADETLFTHGYPVFHGGTVNSTNFPGFFYSDGCGNLHEFKMSSSVYCFQGTDLNGPDIHQDNSYGQLSWEQMDSIYGVGWGIYNHGVNTDNSSDPNFVDYSINRCRSFIRRSLFNTIEGGVLTNVFVNPSGNQYYSQPSFDLGNIAALNQFDLSILGVNGGNVNNPSVNWTQPHNLYRSIAEDINVNSLVDILADSSINGANYWAPIFTHSLTDSYPFPDFVWDFNNIASTYGVDGLDNILMTTDEEILNYLIVRDNVSVNYVVNGTLMLITYSGEVPDNLRFYSSSIVIESDANISSIIVDGTDDYSYAGIGQTNGLVNVNWDGGVIVPDSVLADSVVAVAVASQTQYNCWIAMDYVITLENGNHKDSLRQVLCDISGMSYDEGFCDCEIDIHPADTTISYGDCVELMGADGDYTWEWYVGDSLIATTQDIYPCPEDTIIYTHIATNEFGCPAKDSIIVNINFLEFTLGPDTTICAGSCLEIDGPPDMVLYQWYVEDTPFSTDSIIDVCPMDTTMYILWVEDIHGATASDSITINTWETPVIYFETDTIVSCENVDLNPGLIAEGEIVAFQWIYRELDTITDTIAFVLQTPDTSAMLYVNAVSDSGCVAMDSVYLHLFPFPDIEISPDTSLCKGDSIELKILGGNLFRWISGDDTISMDSVVTVIPDSATYYIGETAFTDSLCYSRDTVFIDMLIPAETKIVYDTNLVCQYEEVVLIAEGAETYLWNPGFNTDTSYTFMIIDTTVVFLTGTSVDGCVLTDSVEIMIKEAPLVNFTGLLAAYCENDASSDLLGTPAGGTFLGPGIVGDMFYPASAGEGVHEIVYQYKNEEGCNGRDTVVTRVYANDGEIDLGSDFTINPTDSEVLNAGAGFDSYFWTTGETTQEITVYGDDKSPGTYEYAVIGVINGCSTRGSVMITFLNPDGIAEPIVKDLVIYPNPTNDKFYIEFESTDSDFEVEVLTLQGHSIYQESNIICNEHCKATIEIPEVAPGIYFIKIYTVKGLVISRVVIN